MALISTSFSTSFLHFPRRSRFCCSSSSIPNSNKMKFMEFSYASSPTRRLMVELLSAVHEQLGSSLQPTCTLPPDVQHFGNSTDTARASIHLRSGLPSSQDLLHFWIESCASFVRDVEASERAYLNERDQVIKNNVIEIDLGSSFPRLFGHEIADTFLNALKDFYNYK